MDDDATFDTVGLPPFDDAQWAFLLRQDELMAQLIRHTAQLELLHTYYQELTAALRRQPSAELHTLRTTTLARLRMVTASAAAVLRQVEQEGWPRQQAA
jgi:hypothetical protein